MAQAPLSIRRLELGKSFLLFEVDDEYCLEWWSRHLNLWRFRALRWRCIFGLHDWKGDKPMQWCDNCPVEKIDGVIEPAPIGDK